MNSIPAPPGGGLRRLWTKLLLAYLLPVTLVVAGNGVLSWRAARLAMEHQLGQHLVTLARLAARLCARPGLENLGPGDEQSRTYQAVLHRLQQLRQAGEAAEVLLFDARRRALADSRQRYRPGEEVVTLAANRHELRRVFAGRPLASMLYTGADGRLYKSGFAPVVYDGRVRAAVVVDGSAAFFGQLDGLRNILSLAALVALALLLALTLFISRAITRPLRRLARAARSIGAGDLQTAVPVETRDEIGLLATTLEGMRRSLQDRDRQMQMMLSGIAHEVRNPLGGMTLFIGLLREDLAGNTAALQKVERVSTELDDLARVVNDFLDFARHKPLQRESCTPRQLLEELPPLLEGLLAERGVRLRLPEPGPAVSLQADPKRLRQVLLNLLRNAIQASPRGGQVEVRLEQEQTGWLRLLISDQGPGIPESLRERIFEPFFTSRQQGTGLGLALARKIVDEHGGSIEFTCPPGGGTTFTVRLPQAGGATAA